MPSRQPLHTDQRGLMELDLVTNLSVIANCWLLETIRARRYLMKPLRKPVFPKYVLGY